MIVNGTASTAPGTGSGLVLGPVGTSMANASLTINGTLELGNQTTGMGWAAGAVSGTNASIDALDGTGMVVANMQTAASTRTLIVGSNNGTGSFSGEIANGNNNTLSLTKTGTGTQTLSGPNTYSGGTAVNAGTLLVKNITGSGTGSGAVTVATGTTHGTLGGTGIINATSVAASITVSGDTVTPANNGVLMVGNSHGIGGNAETLTLGTTGDITLGGMLQFDIVAPAGTGTYSAPTYATQKYDQASSNDLLKFTSANSIAISGILEVAPMDGSAFIAGDTWRLIDWTSLTAHTVAFTDFHLPTLSGGNTWDVLTDQSNFNTFGTISVVSGVPEPSRAVLMLFGAAGLLLRRRRKA